MRVEKSIVLDGRPAEIWEFLWDVQRVASCIRGTSEVVIIEDRHRYKAVVTQKIGPFGVRFPLDIEVLDATPPSTLTIVASGRDARIGSGMKATMRLALEGNGPATTTLTIDTDFLLQGKLASLGQGLVARKVDEELEYFRSALGRELQREVGDG